jgi:hypothetical protein
MGYIRNLVWRVFQCMEIVWVKQVLNYFCLMFVHNLIISNTYLSHQQMCMMQTVISY